MEPVPFFILERGILDSSIMALEVRSRWLMVVLIEIGSEPGRHGRADMTLDVLARRACMSTEDTRAAILELSSPDPNSRSPLEEGRRIIPIDPNRKWGWRLVNWRAKDESRKRLLAAERSARHRALRSVTDRDAPSPSLKEGEEKEKRREEKKNPKETPGGEGGSTRFAPPSLEEVRALVTEKGYSFDPEAFVAFYESNGWKVGSHKMKSWTAACVTWQKRQGPAPARPAPPPAPAPAIRSFWPAALEAEVEKARADVSIRSLTERELTLLSLWTKNAPAPTENELRGLIVSLRRDIAEAERRVG
jgi:hypothetical protein